VEGEGWPFIRYLGWLVSTFGTKMAGAWWRQMNGSGSFPLQFC